VIEPECFLDANIFVRFAMNDHAEHSPLARELIASIDSGQTVAETAATVIFEAVYVLNKTYRVDRARVIDTMMGLVSMPGLRIPNKAAVQRALNLWSQTGRISYADAFHLMLTSETSHKRIATFDKGMGNVLPGVTRIEQLP
jgi:predicted nucleic acid-binding protein